MQRFVYIKYFKQNFQSPTFSDFRNFKASGPFSIPVTLLKALKRVISFPIELLYYFPMQLALSLINLKKQKPKAIPMHKKGLFIHDRGREDNRSGVGKILWTLTFGMARTPLVTCQFFLLVFEPVYKKRG